MNGKLITQFDFELNKGDKVAVMKFDQSHKEKKDERPEDCFRRRGSGSNSRQKTVSYPYPTDEKMRTVCAVCLMSM